MQSPAQYLVLEADVVGSTRLTAGPRGALQADLTDLVLQLNARYHERFRTRLVMAAGDSFQVWDAWLALGEAGIRFGIGFGRIYTEFGNDSRLMDGPAFHNATKFSSKEQGVFFRGFGDAEDAVLNGLGALLRTVFQHFTGRQREALARLRTGMSQSDAADALGISKQAVSRLVKGSGWYGYKQGERAMQEALSLFVAHGDASYTS
jgi:hypothetical protein